MLTRARANILGYCLLILTFGDPAVSIAQAGKPLSSITHYALSADHEYAVAWSDIAAPSFGYRLITLVDLPRANVLFSKVTSPRYTGALWNPSSSRCAVFDAPDPANTNLWIFCRKGDGEWDSVSTEVLGLAVDRYPALQDERTPVRGGVSQMRWSGETTLHVEVLINARRYHISCETAELPARWSLSGPADAESTEQSLAEKHL